MTPWTLVHGILQARILEWVAFPLSRGCIEPQSPTLWVDSLPSESTRKPKNTGVDSLSLLQGIFLTQELNQGLLNSRILYQLNYQGSPLLLSAAAAAKSLQSCPTLCDPIDGSPPGSFVHGDSLGKNNGVGCHAILQGIFLTQGSNPVLLHCRRILSRVSHQRSPRILELVAYAFSKGSS